MNQPLTFGVISCAHGHVHSYMRCLRRIADVRLVGIYDDHLPRGQEAAERHDVPFYPVLDKLLDLNLDGVLVCSENAYHRTHVEAAAGRVRAILCEKPLATTVEDGQAMIDRCLKSGTELQTAFPVRFAPPIQRLKTLLDERAFGHVYGAKCTNHGTMPGGWFVQTERSGGGAVIDHTVHVIDLLRWFWATEVTEVYAEIGTSILHPELGIDDAGLLSFQLANGVYGTLDTSWSRRPSYLTWGDVTVEIVGEKGAVEVDAFEQHLTVASERKGKSHWQNWGSNMDLGLVRDFVEMIRLERKPSITGIDGLRATAVALAAYESAKQQQPIHLT